MLMCQFNLSMYFWLIMFFYVNLVSSNITESLQNNDITDSFTKMKNTNYTGSGNGISDKHNTLAMESRGWKKTALPFLLGITLKMTTLLPMISSLMTVIGGVALVASKLALVISLGLAVHYYMISKHQVPSYSSLYRQPIGHFESVLPVTPYPVTHRLSVQSTSRNVH